jgi:peptidoglycan glycosyltransferase
VLAAQRVRRGSIYDAKGTLLVSSTVTAGDFVQRIYPVADLYNPAAFSNVLGFFSTRFGQSGLEKTYEDYLSGERGSPIGRIERGLLGQPQVGNNLQLTLNAQLQARAYDLLGGRTGSVVVLNPQTGAVLALVSHPGFDPRGLSFNPAAPDRDAENQRIAQYWEQLNADDSGQPLVNRPLDGQYPPGSSFKTVTAAGALTYPDQGQPNSITCPDEFFPEQGTPPVVNAVRQGLEGLIRERSGAPRLENVYALSCNTAFAQYAMRLGPELMTRVAGGFGFFRPQDAPDQYDGFTDLPMQSSKLYLEPGFLNSPAALADTGYGQGQLFVTPAQMAMVAAAIGNNGDMMKLYIVDRVTRPDGGVVFQQGPERIARPISGGVAEEMKRDMAAVVRYGFGQAADDYVPEGVTVGGKSGTAQYGSEGRTHAWYIALAPLDNPRYAVAVMVEGGGEGSSVGAQLAGEVLGAAFASE